MLARPKTDAPGDHPDVEKLIADGDYLEALRRLAQDHGAALGRLCAALLGGAQDAEEVAQETLLAAHKSMPGFRGEGSARSWLFGIARNRCARHRAQKSRSKRREHLAVVGEDKTEGCDARAIAAEKRSHLHRALGRIKPSERETLILRFVGDLSYREIAELCGIEEAAARKRSSRGLAQLREILRGGDEL